jgi:hypothetical protein
LASDLCVTSERRREHEGTRVCIAVQRESLSVEGVEGKLAAKTTAAGQVVRTALTANGVQAKAEAKPGPRATVESEVQMTGAATFIENGRISYGKAGGVTFKTAGHGVLGASGVDGLQRGAVIWEVTEGRGQFAGATGLITSNFTVGAKGEVVDNHYVRLFLPK